ncbi:MAG TPA: hypothetical protein VGF13_02330 [Verrucomicrobiae bacterium]|jgi:hypothetical protein
MQRLIWPFAYIVFIKLVKLTPPSTLERMKFEPIPDVELNPKDEFWVDPDKLDSP